MSRLKNAPLLEVVFELRWDMADYDWMTYPYLQGDIYEGMKDAYPIRELLLPPDVPKELLKGKVQHRFKSKQEYPLFQLGPGLLSFNATDREYEWEEYNKGINNLLDCFFSVNNFKDKKYRPSLNYYDFLPLDIRRTNVLDYISKYLNIKIEQNAYNFEGNPFNFGFGVSYLLDLGSLNLRIDAGAKYNKEPGLILQIQLHAQKDLNGRTEIGDWLERAHSFSSSFFKDLTKGELYDSFNK